MQKQNSQLAEDCPAYPDLDAAIEFLKTFYGSSTPWPLTAALPKARKGGLVTAATFNSDQEKDCRAWLLEQNLNEQLEVYFQINSIKTTLSPSRKKAGENDVWRSQYLWVDIDPEKGSEDLAASQAEMDAIIAKLEPTPTWVIDSGRGRWVLWRIEPSVHLDGSGGKITEDVKARAKTLELQVGKKFADNCRNVDRIGRLPGTINHKTGELARVREYHPERRYPIETFVPHPSSSFVPGASYEKASETAGTAVSTDLHFDEAIHFDHNQLPVSDYVKEVITTGGKIPEKFKSRSEALWFVIRELLKAGTPDILIEHVLLDRDNGISASVLERKDNHLAYVRRQIAKARESLKKFSEDQNGKPIRDSQHNIRIALAQLGVEVRYNEFADRTMIEGLHGFGPVLDDKSLARLWLLVDERFKFRPTRAFFDTVVLDLAVAHRFHPVRDYLDGLRWDGVPRLDTWLTDYAGAEDNDYTRAVGAIVLVAACRRVRQPGCKFDEMLVLESPTQGTDKSTALNALAVRDEWFTDHMPLNRVEPKVFIEATQGRWIIEAADLSGMNKAEVNQLKSVLSRRIDKDRMAYGRMTIEWQRQCVIIGTTNSEEYLKDQTGNRRFWPVRIVKIDVAALLAERDQLWAEAAQREARGESIRLAPSLWPEAGEAQAERTTRDPFLDELELRLGAFDQAKIASADLWLILNIAAGNRDQDKGARLSACMRALGWRRANSASTIDIGGRKVCGWVIGEKPWPRVMVERDTWDSQPKVGIAKEPKEST